MSGDNFILKMLNVFKYKISFFMPIILLIGCSKDVKIPSEDKINVTDIDGNIYHTVLIGKQIWMVENLKTTRYRNGDPIQNIKIDTIWDKLTSGAYCDYNNLSLNGTTYGHLYNGYVVSEIRNICPTGWHMPSKSEWTILVNLFGGQDNAGGALRETGFAHWLSPNSGATNHSGFTALPGGAYGNIFTGIGADTYWWSSTEVDSTAIFSWWVSNNSNLSSYNAYSKNSVGLSIRCIKD